MIILFLILTEQLMIYNKPQEISMEKKGLLWKQANFNRGCCDLDKFPG